MNKEIISIDGRYYNITIPEKGIKRSFEILDTDKAGRLMNGDMERDIIGTYYNYSIEFKTNNLTRQEYDDFYEVISAPVDYHMIRVPYAQSTLELKAYVTSGQDILDRIDANGNKWSGISINFIATSPQRRFE